MPTCSEAFGEGYVGDYPNCTYQPQSPAGTYAEDVPFTGTIDSLGYGEELEGSTIEDDWQKYFDPYDPKGQKLLESAWDLKGKQLGETWGFKRQQLGAGARAGYGKIGKAASRGYQQSNLAFSGTISEMERQKRGEVTEAYKRSFGLGQTAYEQAMEAGELQLESGIFGLETDWEKDQRATLNMLYLRGIWPEDGEEDTNWNTTYEPFQETMVPDDQEEIARKSACEARGGRWNGYTNTCDV
jgi:hypothetical protein